MIPGPIKLTNKFKYPAIACYYIRKNHQQKEDTLISVDNILLSSVSNTVIKTMTKSNLEDKVFELTRYSPSSKSGQ